MNKFSQAVSELPEWPKYCLRSTNNAYADGYGCSASAYRNLTSYFDIESMVNQT